MKQFLYSKRRRLSWLLCVVLVVSLMPAVILNASAVHEVSVDASASNAQYYESGCLKSLDISIRATAYYGTAYGRIAVHNGISTLDYYHPYPVGANGGQWPSLTSDPTFVALGSGAEFEWTDRKLHTMTVAFTDNTVKPGQNMTYYVYLWTRDDDSVYPDARLATITLGEQLKFNDQVVDNIPNPPVHVHDWIANTAGLGTKEASTELTCECNETASFALTASDVTLPGNVFTAQIHNRTLTRIPLGPTVSETPGYKYSATGTDYETIDPNNFTPKPGYYQASILIMNGNFQVENLYVNYIVSDPVVTAATGDNRPIEMMFMGMAACSLLAAAAFILDSKRLRRG